MCSFLSAQDKRFPDGTKVELLFETWSPHCEVDQGEREKREGGEGREGEGGREREGGRRRSQGRGEREKGVMGGGAKEEEGGRIHTVREMK